MIEVDNVSKIYQTAGQEVRALDEVSLRIEKGEFVAIQGESGSGKSTLLSLIGGLALPTAGTITVSGLEVSQLSPAERAAIRATRIGFVFQLFHLLPYLTVMQNVLLSAAGTTENARERAGELLKQFRLGERLEHRPAQLSAGERQRVAMARAILNRPKLLLADEPTGNLDSENAAIILDLLADYHADGGTVLLVTHDTPAAERAQRRLRLARGQLAA